MHVTLIIRKITQHSLILLVALQIVGKGIMTVEGRYQMPDFLTRYVDVVLSQQWENGLNYAYNDALYGGILLFITPSYYQKV